MNSLNVDEILNILSTKFNKIFYDREFVCCVNQDFQVVLKNKNSCCVVVFPTLGPNYLKAVRYQAKIFDLAVFTLGTGRNRAVAVCQKEFLKKSSDEVIETKVQIMPQNPVENNSTKLRKKRPERQLYVPPAQRRLPLNVEEVTCNTEKYHITNEEVLKIKKEACLRTSNKLPLKDLERNQLKFRNRPCNVESKNKCEFKKEPAKIFSDHGRSVKSESEKPVNLDYLLSLNYVCLLWRYKIDENDVSRDNCLKFCDFKYENELLLYNSNRSQLNILYILHNDFVLWQPKLNINFKCDKVYNDTSKIYPIYNFILPSSLNECEEQNRGSVFSINSEIDEYNNVLKHFDYSEYAAFRILWDGNQCICESDVVVDLSVINCGHSFVIHCKNGSDYLYECKERHEVVQCYLDKRRECKHKENACNGEGEKYLPANQNGIPLIKSSVIVLEERSNVAEKKDKPTLSVKKNNDKNTSTNVNLTKNELINEADEIIKTSKKPNLHEQEKEIMRKTKEHINRKSRPIMKYVDDTADTLKIGKNDDVNNWEDLFDDDGQLQEEFFKEVVHKVGTDVTIVKAKEDYSDYVSKQSEDLEHMVELYDFPPTLETHDIIQVFSVINSEAMYVKWVDDTHAILVLGSLTQAQRAVELDNPLIKARPMSVASGISLSTAYKHDLKPAMKRPQTNLQTARRLITTHLGTKSRISKEQNAKERNDLKAAKELKKLARKSEQDAWEGNIRSAMN